MSPKSRGRKRKKIHSGGGRPSRMQRLIEDPMAVLVRELGGAIEEAVEGADPLGAEATAASMFGQMRRAAGGPGTRHHWPR